MNKNYSFCLTITESRGDGVIFSLPQSNQYQQINNLIINPSDYQIANCNNNQVVIFTLNDVKEQIEIKFQTTSTSVRQKIHNRWTIDDYKNSKLPADRFINGDDPEIKKLVTKIIGKEKSLHQLINKLYIFTLDYLTYGKPTDGLYTFKQAMKERITDCGGFSTFLMSLLQSAGVPTRLVSGFIIKDNLYSRIFSNFKFYLLNFNFLLMHAWFEAQLPDESWFPMDPAIEWRRKKGLTKREGGFGFIPADRLVVSFGHDFDLTINKKGYKIDILQKPIWLNAERSREQGVTGYRK